MTMIVRRGGGGGFGATPPSAALLLQAAMTTRTGALAQTVFQKVDDGAMWALDARWKRTANWTDARICLHVPPRPYAEVPCSPGPALICDYGFWSVTLPCTEDEFINSLFQANRYLWAQGKMANLLASKPAGRSRDRDALAWVEWCMEVMRTYSAAVYSTNITARYFTWSNPISTSMNAARAVMHSSLVPLRRKEVMFAPGNFNIIWKGDTPRLVPVTREEWNPVISGVDWLARDMMENPANPSLLIPYRTGRSAQRADVSGDMPWPYWATNPAGGANPPIRDMMLSWFKRTLGTDWWWSTEVNVYRQGSTSPVGRTRLVWGGADVQIAFCEDLAATVISSNYGNTVSGSLLKYDAEYRQIPEQYRALTAGDMAHIAHAFTGTTIDTIATVIGTVSGLVSGIGSALGPVGAIVGAVIAIVLAVVVLVLEIIRAVDGGVLGYGGAEVAMARACIQTPILRTMAGAGADSECNLDARGLMTQAGVHQSAINKLLAVREAAASGVDVRAWPSVIRAALGTDTPPNVPGGRDEFELSPAIIIGAVLVGLGAVYLLSRGGSGGSETEPK